MSSSSSHYRPPSYPRFSNRPDAVPNATVNRATTQTSPLQRPQQSRSDSSPTLTENVRRIRTELMTEIDNKFEQLSQRYDIQIQAHKTQIEDLKKELKALVNVVGELAGRSKDLKAILKV